MDFENDELPMRLRPQSEQPEEFRRERRGRYFLKSSEFRKIYNKVVNPYLKELGFKTSGTKATKEDERFYYVLSFAMGKAGGSGCLDLYLHPTDGFPSIQEYEWTRSRIGEQNHYLFKKMMNRTYPNDWTDTGTNEDEARESCEFLLHHLKKKYEPYMCQFESFPQSILDIHADNFEERYIEVYDKFSINVSGISKYYAAVWLAKLHCFHETNLHHDIAEIARREITAICEERGDDVTWFDEYIDKIQNGILF